MDGPYAYIKSHLSFLTGYGVCVKNGGIFHRKRGFLKYFPEYLPKSMEDLNARDLADYLQKPVNAEKLCKAAARALKKEGVSPDARSWQE